MTLERIPLSQNPALLPTVAAWYFTEWGSHMPGRTEADECQRLEVFLHDAALPLLLIALDDGEPVAAAQLNSMNAPSARSASTGSAASTCATRTAAEASPPC